MERKLTKYAILAICLLIGILIIAQIVYVVFLGPLAESYKTSKEEIGTIAKVAIYSTQLIRQNALAWSFVILCLWVLIFWLIMLVDSIKRDFAKGTDKIIWILLLVIFGIFAAIPYYFLIKKKQ